MSDEPLFCKLVFKDIVRVFSIEFLGLFKQNLPDFLMRIGLGHFGFLDLR
jgi:hypothetical protein